MRPIALTNWTALLDLFAAAHVLGQSSLALLNKFHCLHDKLKFASVTRSSSVKLAMSQIWRLHAQADRASTSLTSDPSTSDTDSIRSSNLTPRNPQLNPDLVSSQCLQRAPR